MKAFNRFLTNLCGALGVLSCMFGFFGWAMLMEGTFAWLILVGAVILLFSAYCEWVEKNS